MKCEAVEFAGRLSVDFESVVQEVYAFLDFSEPHFVDLGSKIPLLQN